MFEKKAASFCVSRLSHWYAKKNAAYTESIRMNLLDCFIAHFPGFNPPAKVNRNMNIFADTLLTDQLCVRPVPQVLYVAAKDCITYGAIAATSLVLI